MRGLPSGTITFLFTDVEGFNGGAWPQLGERVRDVVPQHHQVAAQGDQARIEAPRSEPGVIECFTVFASPTDALAHHRPRSTVPGPRQMAPKIGTGPGFK